VHIQERKTLVLWCVNEQCFYIDENGYAYAPVDAEPASEQFGPVFEDYRIQALRPSM